MGYSVFQIGLESNNYDIAVKELENLYSAAKVYYSIVDFENNKGQVM